MRQSTDISRKPLSEVVDDIVDIHRRILSFWKSAYGWAPDSAADLLNRSRLDWQVSLSICLKSACRQPRDPEMTHGSLILGWANLGALVEGAMKFFLCVFYTDYARAFAMVKATQKTNEPDALALEGLKQFFLQQIWTTPEDRRQWLPFVEQVQKRRNAIHAFKSRDIGTHREFRDAVRMYYEFLSDIHGTIPYPEPHHRDNWL